MSKEKRRVPKLRFPGFTEDWEQYRLDELLIERSILCTQSEKYPLVSFTVERGVTPKTERYNREALVVGNKASKKYKLTLMDDIVYNPANLKFGAIARNKYGKAVFSPIYVTLEVKSDRIISDFLEYILTSKSFINKALRYQQGTVYERQSVNVESFLLQTINIPTVNEQIAISNLLYKYDKIISIYKHKLVVLNLKKKALLQKLFPKQGATCPTLRFPGYTDDWEQRKLGEIVNSYSRGTPTASNKEYYGGDIPFIRSAEINSDSTELYITQKGLDNSSAKIVEKGTILYAMYGATSGEVGISKINGAINQAILAMIPLEYNGKIIAQYLRKNKESITGKYLQGGQGNLSANIILELPIQLPGLEESNQIANFLESFDNIITLHQRKLEHLQLQKKSLLQQMFV